MNGGGPTGVGDGRAGAGDDGDGVGDQSVIGDGVGVGERVGADVGLGVGEREDEGVCQADIRQPFTDRHNVVITRPAIAS